MSRSATRGAAPQSPRIQDRDLCRAGRNYVRAMETRGVCVIEDAKWAE